MKASLYIVVIALLILGTVSQVSAMTPWFPFCRGRKLGQSICRYQTRSIGHWLASHALLDAIPHNDEALEIALTTAIGAALLTHQVMQREDVDWELFLTGGLGGILPDGEHFLKRNGFIERSLYPSHNGTIKQPRTEPVWALWFELGLLWWLLRWVLGVFKGYLGLGMDLEKEVW